MLVLFIYLLICVEVHIKYWLGDFKGRTHV